MKTTKCAKRTEWLTAHKAEIEQILLMTPRNHVACKGNCANGRTCTQQSGGGWGWWAQALICAGIEPHTMRYWSGMCTTPSTSIDKRLAAYISAHREELTTLGIY